MKKLTSACALALVLSGCNTLENRAGIDRVDARMLTSQNTGVAIFSTGADRDCMSVATFMRLFDQTTLRPVNGVAAAPVDGYASKSDFTDHRGNVSAYALQPGKYYLSPMTANPYVVGVKVPAFAFEVHAGETVYLGELYMPVACSFRNAFKINDRYDRDVAMAMRQNPGLLQRAPVKRLLADHVAGDGGSVDLPAPNRGIPIGELFSPPPRRPENGGVATLKDVVPQVLPAAGAPPAPLQVTTVRPPAEKWTGTMSCGARLDGTKKAYDASFAMEKRGNDVAVFRKTAMLAEVLSGRVDGAALALTGTGKMDDASSMWSFHFAGRFEEGAASWDGTGELTANRVVMRQCVLKMRRQPGA
jgi:hypothetical protein